MHEIRQSLSDRPALGKTLRHVWLLGLPLLVGNLSNYLHQVLDSAMLGHFPGEGKELAAMGIAGLFTWILNTLLWPVNTGIQALASRQHGKAEADATDHHEESKHQLGRVFDNGLAVALMAFTLALALSFTVRPVLGLLVQDADVLRLAVDYVGVMRWGLLPFAVFMAYQGFLGGLRQTRYIMVAVVASSLTNIFLNWVFIFGNLGMPALGMRGAALGTAAANLVSALVLAVAAAFKGWSASYGLFRPRHLSPALQGQIVKVALPPGIQNLGALFIFMVYQTIVEDYSAVLLAATHATFSWFRINKTLIGGFARAASIRAGNSLGAGNRAEALRSLYASGIIGVLVAGGMALASTLGSGLLAHFYSADPATQEGIRTAVAFFWPFFLMEALGYAFEMVFVGNGHGRYVLASEISTNLVFILGATLVVRWLWPGNIQLAWLTFGVYQVSHALIMIAGGLRTRWIAALRQ